MTFQFRHLPITRHEDTTAVLEQLQPVIGGLVATGSTNQSLASNVTALEGKTADSGWKTVEFKNSWKSVAGLVTVAYRKQGNTVRVRGTLESGVSGKPAFELPEGFRPTGESEFTGIGAGVTAAAIRISPAGVFTPFGTPAISINGITFTVD